MTARDIRAGKGYVELGVKDYLQKGLKRAMVKLKAFGQSLTNIGAKIAAVGTAGASAFIHPIMAASKLQETMNKFNVVFGDNSQAMQKWGDDLAERLGRGRTQVKSFLAGTQDLLVPMGFEAGTAEEMSKTLTKLAYDLASFNDMADADVMNDLQNGLTGSSEVLKKYGVIANDAAVKQELLNQGLDPKDASEATKAMARFAIVMRGTTAAQGDVERSSDSFENQLKRLRAEYTNASEKLGAVLLPTVTAFISKMADVVKTISEWIQANPGLIKTIAAVAIGVTALGGALIITGSLISAIVTIFGAVVTAGSFVISVLGMIFTPLGAIAALLAAGVWVAFGENLKRIGKNFLETFGDMKKHWQSIIDLIKAGDFENAFKVVGISVWSAVKRMFTGIVDEARIAVMEAKKFALFSQRQKDRQQKIINATRKHADFKQDLISSQARSDIAEILAGSQKLKEHRIKEAIKAAEDANKEDKQKEGLSGHERAQKYLDEEKVAKVDKTIKAVAGDPGAFTRSSVEGQRKAFENAMKQLMPKKDREADVAKKLEEQKALQKKMLQQIKNLQPVAVVG